MKGLSAFKTPLLCGALFLTSVLNSCRVPGYHHGVVGRPVLQKPDSNILKPIYFYDKNGQGYEVLQNQPYVLILSGGLSNQTLTLPNGNRPALQPGQKIKIDLVNEQNKDHYAALLKQYSQDYGLEKMKFSQDVRVGLAAKTSPCGVEQLKYSNGNVLRPQTTEVLTGALYLGLVKTNAGDFGRTQAQHPQAICEVVNQQQQGYNYTVPIGRDTQKPLTERDMVFLMFGANIRSSQNTSGTVNVSRNSQFVNSNHAVIVVPGEPSRPMNFGN